MPNYSGLLNSNVGLVGGLAEGVNSAINSFRQGRRDVMDEEELALTRRMRDKSYALQLAQSGLEDDGTGKFHESPVALAKKKREDEEKRAFEKYKTDLETKKALAVAAAEAKSLSGLLKGYQVNEAIKKANDPYEQAPKLVQDEVNGLTETNTKRQSGLMNLNSVLKQLEDPNLSEDQKILAGQGALKWLNDPVNADVVGAEESKRIGGLLQNFQWGRPGGFLGIGIGRDLPGFTEQVRNKALAVENSKFATEDQVAGLLKQPSGEHKSQVPPGKSGLKAGDVKDGWRFKGGDPAKKENWEKQ